MSSLSQFGIETFNLSLNAFFIMKECYFFVLEVEFIKCDVLISC